MEWDKRSLGSNSSVNRHRRRKTKLPIRRVPSTPSYPVSLPSTPHHPHRTLYSIPIFHSPPPLPLLIPITRPDSSYILHPLGSVSKIEELKSDPSNPSSPPKSTMLELFSSGDLPLGRLFMHRKLDSAMVAFLDCLRQLGDFAEAHDANLKLPYKYLPHNTYNTYNTLKTPSFPQLLLTLIFPGFYSLSLLLTYVPFPCFLNCVALVLFRVSFVLIFFLWSQNRQGQNWRCLC